MSLTHLRALDPIDRALVAVAVLIDGSDASLYLDGDADRSQELKQAVEELCRLEIDGRLAFVGTVLRLALEEVG
jgi:hypothetical protein